MIYSLRLSIQQSTTRTCSADRKMPSDANPQGWDRNYLCFPARLEAAWRGETLGQSAHDTRARISWFSEVRPILGRRINNPVTFEGAGDFKAVRPGGKIEPTYGVRRTLWEADCERALTGEAQDHWRDILIFSDYARPPIRTVSDMEMAPNYNLFFVNP